MCVYASRMSLGEALVDAGVRVSGLPSVRHHDVGDRLCELTRFASNDQAGQLINLVERRCQDACHSDRVEETLTMSIWELTDNCLAHARIGHGFLAAQVLPQPTRSLHFAVADGGIGIRASFAGTQHERDDDRSAIEAAVESRVTSVRDKPRGVGLPNLLEWVTAMGGGLTIRSGRAAIEYRHQPNSTMPRATFSHVDAVDGPLVAGWVPC